MRIDEMRKYAACIGGLMRVPEWTSGFPALLRASLGEEVEQGYARVLSELVPAAYEMLSEQVGKECDPEDLSALLRVRAPRENYKIGAYYFVVSTVAIAMERLSEEEIDLEQIDRDELFEFDTSVSLSSAEDSVAKRLAYYKNRLLDFSRNNQLVHFRALKSSTLALHPASGGRLMQALDEGKRIYIARWSEFSDKPEQILQCKQCGKYVFRKYDHKTARHGEKCSECDGRGTGNRKSVVPIREKLTLLGEEGISCAACGTQIPYELWHTAYPKCPQCEARVELAAYPLIETSALQREFGADAVVCHVNDQAAEESATELIRRAERLERNFGLHSLYLACGFLDWVDMNGTSYHSPILLRRIDLHLDRSLGRFYFEADLGAEESFTVNKTLLRMLSMYSSTVAIPLPDYGGRGAGYFAHLRKTWREYNRSVSDITASFRISEDMGIGFFHYQKLQLEFDLDTNRERYLAHPVIRRLCGDADCDIGSAPRLSDSFAHMTMDADASQEKVIRASQEGRSFILQGPPGSGKSQTISNIISVAIGEGKSVLFVTEKATARAIIVDNLASCTVDGTRNLSNYVLDFDRFSTRRGAVGQRPLLEDINGSRDPYTTMSSFHSLLSDEKYYRGKVERFMRQITEKHDGYSGLSLIQDIAPYVEYRPLRAFDRLDCDRIVLPEIVGQVGEYYSLVRSGAVALDYRTDSLRSYTGDDPFAASDLSEAYLATSEQIGAVCRSLSDKLSLRPNRSGVSLYELTVALSAWLQMPSLAPEILSELSSPKLSSLIRYAEERRDDLAMILREPGAALEGSYTPSAEYELSIGTASAAVIRYANPLKRLSRTYRATLGSILKYLQTPGKLCYKTLVTFSKEFDLYASYKLKLDRFREGEEQDMILFGERLRTVGAWNSLICRLRAAQSVFSANRNRVISTAENRAFVERFGGELYEQTMHDLSAAIKELIRLDLEEQRLSAELLRLFDAAARSEARSERHYECCADLATCLKNEETRLGGWKRVKAVLDWFDGAALTAVLDELITLGITDSSVAEKMVCRSYYGGKLRGIAEKHALDTLSGFSGESHRAMLEHYSQIDLETLRGGATRLYSALSEKMKEAGAVYARAHSSSSELPKIPPKTGVSIRQVIADNWEYIRHIKPCFMMSPLNVSQYIDIALQFDMVIFDEASQIFTEDALASIVRGKQVIIAGDSKQLPPCDFFRASGNSANDPEEMREITDEAHENSLLTAADKALGDMSISLDWHYRSYDEALIAFSNEHFAYNLITFPSAIKNPNDGIELVKIPYTPETCYESGKNGSHINRGEADAIVARLWDEINHPERSRFSLGVVAFSNAQALEIETRWNAFRELPETNAVITAWEREHADEPIIFCNLDTMQGDERDTMLISVCYSRDAEEKFSLSYLGRIRLEAGKKRINVAITRSRHRMIVFSTLEVSALRAAISSSSAPAQNKEGAEVLCDFLAYAETFRHENRQITGVPVNAFVRTVCRVLDAEGVAYDTEIGRSECKISIGIKSKGDPNSYVLGIIVDDLLRTDFDSAREYARLTEQVLTKKYNWKLFRLFPLAWILDFERERDALLVQVRASLA